VGELLIKGKRASAASGVLVKPADGWTFQPLRIFDIKSLSIQSGPEGAYMAVKQQEAPTPITVTLKLAISNSFDKMVVDQILEDLKGMPGFVSLDRS
jgi:hypothetical protein